VDEGDAPAACVDGADVDVVLDLDRARLGAVGAPEAIRGADERDRAECRQPARQRGLGERLDAERPRVGSVAASAPLFTVVGSLIGARAAFAWVTPDALSALSIVGALCVVAGSMVSALGSRRQKGSTRTS